ncbi:TPA: hypothetical protein NKQ52_005062 [Vibrio parahaemolyticus]|nr:hypothetical protein [Vibrio parahaemolyticus]HCH1657822.1 hypothetical protein [Vibrio parahaemolyticus]HCH1661189.1 hypothetical protein [Vibrio parahaemolyticus]
MRKLIVNKQALKAYDLGDIEFKTTSLWSRFSHSDLDRLPEHVLDLIKADLRDTDILTYEALTAQERAFYEVVCA